MELNGIDFCRRSWAMKNGLGLAWLETRWSGVAGKGGARASPQMFASFGAMVASSKVIMTKGSWCRIFFEFVLFFFLLLHLHLHLRIRLLLFFFFFFFVFFVVFEFLSSPSSYWHCFLYSYIFFSSLMLLMRMRMRMVVTGGGGGQQRCRSTVPNPHYLSASHHFACFDQLVKCPPIGWVTFATMWPFRFAPQGWQTHRRSATFPP